MKEQQKLDNNQFSSKYESEINDKSINKKIDIVE
jgi:hypothetical protein